MRRSYDHGSYFWFGPPRNAHNLCDKKVSDQMYSAGELVCEAPPPSERYSFMMERCHCLEDVIKLGINSVRFSGGES